MIDLHSHVLPGIDDGAKDACESVQLLSESYSQGINVCVATPHITVHDNEMISSFLANRTTSINTLKDEIRKTNTKIPKMLFGAEVFLDNDVSDFENIKELCIGNTNSMLLELPVITYSPLYAEWLYSLSIKGIEVILAHVERYPYLDRLKYELDETEITYQVNAETLFSLSGRRFIKKLYQTENSVIISSDVHNSTTRRNHMLDAYTKIMKKSKEMADDIFKNNAVQLLTNNTK